MTQVWGEDGKVIPVTLTVLQEEKEIDSFEEIYPKT